MFQHNNIQQNNKKNKPLKERNAKTQRGFIGAIGDDLPSLVPIFFSLLIFFATLSFVFITLNERNSYLERYFESISISRKVLGSSFYSGYTDFEEKVANLTTPERYVVGLIYDPNLLGTQVLNKDYFVQTFNYNNNAEYIIPYAGQYPGVEESYCTIEETICEGLSDSDTNVFLKSNQPELDFTSGDPFDLKIIFKNKNPFVYLYPVSLSTSKGVVNVYLYVLVW